MRLLKWLPAAVWMLRTAAAIEMDLDDAGSIKDAASTIAFGLMKYYTGNNTGDVPGNLPDPYFWWEAGAMFGHMIDYWHMTGDDTYNEVTQQAIVHQSGEDRDFMVQNQTRTLGNDDQGFWAMTAMSAAENAFPDPPDDQPQWLALVQATFNLFVSRWDTEHCGGGLRWQIFQLNNGFSYKNSISNGCFFNIASRLARYTGLETYAEWAADIWDWQVNVGFILDDYRVEDGAEIDNGCAVRTEILWSYNAGIFLHGAAAMYNLTGSDTWKTRLDGLLERTTAVFFNETVAYEQACEPFRFCNIDQRTFKGYLLRWMAATTHLAPHTAEVIIPLLRSSAAAAAASCNGDATPAEPFAGIPGTACGQDWTRRTFDGFVGVGEQMNAMAAVQFSLLGLEPQTGAPVTADSGGTSKGDVSAGEDSMQKYEFGPIGTGDRVAAGFLTAAMCLGVVAGCVFVIQ